MEIDEKTLSSIQKMPCVFPECKHDLMMHVTLPIAKLLEDGELKIQEGISLAVPACAYHFPILTYGGFCLIEKDGNIGLHGPIHIVPLIEVVVRTMIMSGTVERLSIAAKAVDEKMEKMKKEDLNDKKRTKETSVRDDSKGD